MAQFRKKPVVIEAVQYTGGNAREVMNFIDTGDSFPTEDGICIKTLEGTMLANINDWIIRGVKGEFYPCKPDIFYATYDPA